MLPCPCGGLKAPLVASLQESGAMQSCGEVTLHMSRSACFLQIDTETKKPSSREKSPFGGPLLGFHMNLEPGTPLWRLTEYHHEAVTPQHGASPSP